MEAFIRAMRAPPRRGQAARPPLGRVVLRLARRHRGRQAPRRRSAATTSQGRAGLANARAAYRPSSASSSGERFAALREAGCPVQRPLWASTGVEEPGVPRDALRLRPGRRRTRSTRCRCRRCMAAARRRRGDRRDGGRRTRRPTSTRCARPGIDLDDVTDKLLRDGIEAFVVPMDKLLDGIEAKREAIVTGRPAAIEADLPDDLERAARRARCAAPPRTTSRAASGASDGTLWAPAGHARARRPARLADDRRQAARGAPTRSTPSWRSARPTG